MFGGRAQFLVKSVLDAPAFEHSEIVIASRGSVMTAWHTMGGVGAGTAPCLSHRVSQNSGSQKFLNFGTNEKEWSTCHREAGS